MNDTITAELAELRRTAPGRLEAAALLAVGVTHAYTVVRGPTGDLYIAWSPEGVAAIAPTALGEATFVADYAARTGKELVRVVALPERLARRLATTFETGKVGNLPVDLTTLTPFQQAVLKKTAQVPPGELRPYGWVAKEIGNPGAVRAVGSALAKNPVPVVIPCHRVGRGNGTVGRYAYGPEMKRALLAAEGLDPDEVDERARRGVRFTGSDTTRIFCNPTCRHARGTLPTHTVDFRNEDEARAAGYRPCKVCRPVAA